LKQARPHSPSLAETRRIPYVRYCSGFWNRKRRQIERLRSAKLLARDYRRGHDFGLPCIRIAGPTENGRHVHGMRLNLGPSARYC